MFMDPMLTHKDVQGSNIKLWHFISFLYFPFIH